MLGVAIIVFRETLEAAMFVGIIAAATMGLAGRGRWLLAGVVAGVIGALVLAAAAEYIGAWAGGVGQDLMNAAILGFALVMLAWHCVWVSNRGGQAATNARMLGASFKLGQRTPWALLIVVALSVLREGAETVLFVAGYATSSGATGVLSGALLGVLFGVTVGGAIYLGLSRVPMRHMFTVTNTLIMLLAAAIASQLAQTLSQAGVLNAWGQPVWDSSGVLGMDSALGTLAHAILGYEARPTGMQIAFYAVVLVSLVLGGRRVRQSQSSRRVRPTQRLST